MEFAKLIFDNVDFYEKNFLEACVLTIVSIASITLLPHLQYRYKIISKMTGDDMGRAADFLAFFLIHVGTFKNYAFFETMFTNKTIAVGNWFYYTLFPLGILMFALGMTLVVFSFHRLGLRGMYFGDHFGFLFKGRIDKFPYNYIENPQYVGNNLAYLGLSLAFRSLPGVMLTLFMILCTRIFFVLFERKKLKIFYPQYDSEDSTSSNNSNKKLK